MRISLILLSVAMLLGCGAGTSSNTEPDKEPEMFGKKPKQNYVIFSPMQGVLMQNGKPLANTKLVRRLRWNGNDDEGLAEEFVTDEQGRFSLPVHEEELSLGMLSQFVSKAYIEVEVSNENHEIWYSTKFDPAIYAETSGPLENLVCDLATEKVTFRIGLSKISSSCRWENMPKI